MRRPKNAKALGALLLLLLITGCTGFIDASQPAISSDCAVTLSTTAPVGQTFVARHGGLDAFELYLTPDVSAAGILHLHLRASPVATTDIVTSTLLISPNAPSGYYRFSFPPILHSHTQYYYAYVESAPGFVGVVQVPCAPIETYADGALYQEHVPVVGQSSFRLQYAPAFIALDLGLMVLAWVGYGVAVVGILFFAGYGFVRGWARKAEADFTITLMISAVVALSAWMVFLVWGDLIDLRLSPWLVRGLVGAVIAGGLYAFFRDREVWQKRAYWLGKHPASTLLLWVTILGGIGFRLFLGRSMVMLPGSDTYHHTLIVQMFMDQGGLPDTYEPYAPMISFSYHFGFHSIVALFRWLFGTELLLTTKTTALVLNGAIAATTALLSERLTGDRKAGIITAALSGLIMISPFCLLRWGRFTQATGMMFLPLAILALAGDRPPAWKTAGLFIASMVFAHFRLFFFWGMWMALWGLVNLAFCRWEMLKQWLAKGLVALVLCVPFLVRLALNLADVASLKIHYPLLPGYNDALQRLETPVLHFRTNQFVLGIVLLGVASVFILKRHRLQLSLLCVWAGLLVGGASLQQLGIGGSFWELKTVVLTLAVPVAVVAGIGWSQWLQPRLFYSNLMKVIMLIAFMLLIAQALFGFPNVLHSGLMYLEPGSLVDMEWISANTAPDARFIGDSVEVEWSPGWVVGIGEGYWIPLLAQRNAAPPPMIYPHEFVVAEKITQDVQLAHALRGLAAGARWQELSQILRANDIQYWVMDTRLYQFDLETLKQAVQLRPVYHRDYMLILEVVE